MLRTYVLVLQCALGALAAPYTQAQSHFTTCSDGTGNVFNATVIVPDASFPNVNGNPLPHGSEIAVYSESNQLCAGVVTWHGANALTVWRDNPLTLQRDGMQAGEALRFRIWNKSTGAEYAGDAVRIAYESGHGRYRDDARHVLADLSVDIGPQNSQPVGEL